MKDLPSYIPLSLLHPIVKEYCDSREMGFALMKVGRRVKDSVGNHSEGDVIINPKQRYSAKQALADVSGVKLYTIEKIYDGEEETQIKFDVVDTLLCTMDLEYLWFDEPLINYYGGVT